MIPECAIEMRLFANCIKKTYVLNNINNIYYCAGGLFSGSSESYLGPAVQQEKPVLFKKQPLPSID
jgi:hypothetical protein